MSLELNYFIFSEKPLLATIKQQKLFNSKAVSDILMDVENTCTLDDIFVEIDTLLYWPEKPMEY